MKNSIRFGTAGNRVFFATCVLASALAARAAPPAFAPYTIYGPDDRRDLIDVRDPGVRALFGSEVALVATQKLHRVGGGWTRIDAKTLGESHELCPGERFRAQPTAAECTGVLVARDTVITAAHCFDRDTALRDIRFVFGFHHAARGDDPTLVRDRDVYAPSALLFYRSEDTPLDYAVFRLDRPAAGHRPVAFAQGGSVRVGTPIYMIGHPSGLPAKWAPNARVRSVDTDDFKANLDAFGGNSGSPVFDADTGVLIGLLNDGEVDYVRDEKLGCNRPKRCTNRGCRGETVKRIDRIVEDIRGGNARP